LAKKKENYQYSTKQGWGRKKSALFN